MRRQSLRLAFVLILAAALLVLIAGALALAAPGRSAEPPSLPQVAEAGTPVVQKALTPPVSARTTSKAILIKLSAETESQDQAVSIPRDRTEVVRTRLAGVMATTTIQPVFPALQPEANSAADLAARLAQATDLAHWYRIEVPDDADVAGLLTALRSDPAVAWAEPDYLAHAAWTPNDPRYADQWGLAKIQAAAAWDVTKGSPAVAIAVIDTGVDLNHPDLASKLWINPGEIAGNGLDDDGNGKVDDVNGWDWVNNGNTPQDDIGHGTHVAGIAAAATNNGVGVAGACPNCRVMALKVLDAGGSGTYSNIAQGITYAADKGAKVVNLSLGGYADSQLLRDAVAYASQTAVVVAAAGNDNKQDRFYPAAYDDYVIAVAATDNNDQKAAFANYGDWVDLSAPGVSIWSTLFDDAYDDWSGSSMAAPFVSGVAGLIRAKNPAWSAGAVRGQLLHTADAIDGANPNYAGKLGVGRLNANLAVTVNRRPQLRILNYTINDVQNGKPEPGTSVKMTVGLLNTWGDVSGVSGVLSTTDTHVTLTDATATFGDIAGYRVVTNTLDALGFLVTVAAPYDLPIPFDLTLSGDGGNYVTTLPLTVTIASGLVNVSGAITDNTTWTPDRVYHITGNMLISPGVTLTIRAGTSAYLGADCYLEVQGTLRVEGERDKPVRFLPLGTQPWGGIYFRPSARPWNETAGTGSILSHCYLYGGGGNRYEGDVMKRDSIVADAAGVKIEYCTIAGSTFDGIRSDAPVETIIQDSIIQDNNGRGVLAFRNVSIGHSILRRNSPAIYSAGGSFPRIFSNLIAQNGGGMYAGGIRIDGSASITSNLLSGNEDNDVAFIGPGSTGAVTGNNFVGGSRYAVFLYSTSTDLPASGNWWATTNLPEIGQRIYDYNDDFVLGTVQYVPTLDGPSNTTPPLVRNIALDPNSPIGLGAATFTLDFSKPMSPTVMPTVTFGISPTMDTHLVRGDWISSTRWVGNYDVTYYTGDGVQRMRVAGAVGADDGMEIPEDTSFTFRIATIGATNIDAKPGYGYVALSWSPSNLPTLAGYNVYRATTSGGPYTRLNDRVLTTTAYTDTAVINNTLYYYLVKLLTTDLYESVYGAEQGVRPTDGSPPTTPVVTDDGACTTTANRLHATWFASDPESGIVEYQYSIGTWAGGTDVINWTSVGVSTEVTRTGLTLFDEVEYYFNVKARNGVETWSVVGSSDGILVNSAGCVAVSTPTPTATSTPTRTATPTCTPTPAGQSIQLPLVVGWNLVGYPAPVARPVAEALASISGKYDLVFGYEASAGADAWKKYDPAAPAFANDLATMVLGKGYWIRATQDCIWTVTW